MRQYSDIWKMIQQLPGEEEAEELKRTLCEGVSEGRTDSLRALTGGELSKLRNRLRELTGFKPTRASKEVRRLRSAVLRQLTTYGIDTKDWDTVNQFVEQPRIAGKTFEILSLDELRKLQRKMHAIIRKQKEKRDVQMVENREDSVIKTTKKIAHKQYLQLYMTKANKQYIN